MSIWFSSYNGMLNKMALGYMYNFYVSPRERKRKRTLHPMALGEKVSPHQIETPFLVVPIEIVGIINENP
jgi:hypothetical protein